MDIQRNDLIRLFEAYYRHKEHSPTIPRQMFMSCIHAGIAGLEVDEEGKKCIIKQSIDDFKEISNLIQIIYEQLYPYQETTLQVPENSPKQIMTLDEVIQEFRLTPKIKDAQWRKNNPDFPFSQPTGSRGKVIVYRGEIEHYIKQKK